MSKLSFSKGMAKILGIVLVPVILFLGYFAVVTNLAKNRADGICSTIQVGASISAAEKIVSEAGIYEHLHPTLRDMINTENLRRYLPDFIVIVIPATLGERWVCKVEFAQGRVAGKEVFLVD
jgi:hypothetical protein